MLATRGSPVAHNTFAAGDTQREIRERGRGKERWCVREHRSNNSYKERERKKGNDREKTRQGEMNIWRAR
jgi:hypothetical protein